MTESTPIRWVISSRLTMSAFGPRLFLLLGRRRWRTAIRLLSSVEPPSVCLKADPRAGAALIAALIELEKIGSR